MRSRTDKKTKKKKKISQPNTNRKINFPELILRALVPMYHGLHFSC